MPLRGFRTVSFVGVKKVPTDPCILCSVRSIDDPKKSPLPRTRSDLANRKITLVRTDSSDSDSSGPHMSPPLYECNESPPSEISPKSMIFMTPLEANELEESQSPSSSSDSLDALSSTPPTESVPPLVLRRPKGNAQPGSQKRMNRRGVVWTGEENKKNGSDFISDPILISHPSLRIGYQVEPRFRPRSTEEQQELLRKLAESKISSTPPKLGGDTNNNESKSKQIKRAFTLERLKDSSTKSRPPSGGNKMATRIQRTIRALYDSRRSFERLEEFRSSEEELTDEESLGSDRWGFFIFSSLNFIQGICSFRYHSSHSTFHSMELFFL